MTFLGHDNESKALRCYNPETRIKRNQRTKERTPTQETRRTGKNGKGHTSRRGTDLPKNFCQVNERKISQEIKGVSLSRTLKKGTFSQFSLKQKIKTLVKDFWHIFRYIFELVKRVVKYLKGTSELKLKLSDSNELFGYPDANWAEDKQTRWSHSSNVFFSNRGIINWSCRKQTCVSLSSIEAEFIALSDTCQETIWLRRLLEDMYEESTNPTLIYEDNQSCIKIIEKEKFSNRTKHIDTKVHFVKDHIEKGHISYKFCPKEEMTADLFTKPLAPTRYAKLREKCKVI